MQSIPFAVTWVCDVCTAVHGRRPDQQAPIRCLSCGAPSPTLQHPGLNFNDVVLWWVSADGDTGKREPIRESAWTLTREHAMVNSADVDIPYTPNTIKSITAIGVSIGDIFESSCVLEESITVDPRYSTITFQPGDFSVSLEYIADNI